MAKRAVLYLRVSSREQVDNFSLENQESICKDYCRKNDYQVVKVFIEPGESAKTDDRPRFQEMLLFCRKKENNINMVVFYHSSRFSRDTKDFLIIQADLARYGINLDSVTEPLIKEISPEATLYTQIVSSFNEYENSNKARNTVNGMRRRFIEGYSLNNPPLGYVLAQKTGERSIAVRDKTWWPIIKSMWERIPAEKLGIMAVLRELNKYQLRKFTKSSVSHLFHNPFYYGMMKSVKFRLEVMGQHEPMISKDLYYQAQAILDGKEPTNKIKGHYRDDFLLRGFLVCPECGHQMTSCWSKGQRARFPYYLCSTRGKHTVKSYPRDLVENQFRELLRNLQPTAKYWTYYRERILETYQARNQVILETQDKIKTDLHQIEGMLDVLKEKHLKGIYNDSDFMEMRDSLETRLMAKKNLIADKSITIEELKVKTAWFGGFLTNLEKVFTAATPEVRQLVGCSIFPEGLNFKDGEFRTPKMASAFELKDVFADSQSNQAPLEGIEPPNLSLRTRQLYPLSYRGKSTSHCANGQALLLIL